MNDSNGIELLTGKVGFTFPLANLTGPNGYGTSFNIDYSSVNLLNKLKVWNQDAPTSVLGLGWSFDVPFISRIGNGCLEDSFFLGDGDLSPLILIGNTLDGSGLHTLTFTTQNKSLTQITYQTNPTDFSKSPEIWTLIDEKGDKYIYGGNPSGIDKVVRWVTPDDINSPLNWTGASTQFAHQQNYALIWRLTSQSNVYGQTINYEYLQLEKNIGLQTQGNTYTVASYLVGIQVVNGDSLKLVYEEKNPWEYPSFRFKPDGSNAYQDRIETQYLSQVLVYDSLVNLKTIVRLEYDFLFAHIPDLTIDDKLKSMQKRVLTRVQALTPDGFAITPPQQFNYWGLDGKAEGYKNHFFNITNNNLLKILDNDLFREFSKTTSDGKTQDYGALFGHLSKVTSAMGAVTWYSYANNAVTHAQDWEFKLDISNLKGPDDDVDNWENPTPYWGPDGFVVIRWDSKNKNPSGFYQSYFQIYEWLGKWVEVKLTTTSGQDPHTYTIQGSDDAYIRVAVASGKFCLVRTDIDSNAHSSPVTFFNRHPFLPGQWQVSSFSPATKAGKFSPGNNFSHNINQYVPGAYYLSVQAGNSIVAILDIMGGRLYRYSYNTITGWTAYDDASGGIEITDAVASSGTYFTNACSSMIVVNDSLFVMCNVNLPNANFEYDLVTKYWLWHFDNCCLTNAGDPWYALATKKLWDSSFGEDYQPYSTLVGLTSIQGNGLFMIQGILAVRDSFTDAPKLWIARPVIISWDLDTSRVNFQEVYTPQGPKNDLLWGFTAAKTTWSWEGTNPGTIAASNLLNVTTASSDPKPKKYVARFVGGTADGGFREGWNGDQTIDNLATNSDVWVKMATLDTTIGIASNGTTNYGYDFFQYDVYANCWNKQPDIYMGNNTDWEKVFRIIEEILFFMAATISLADPFVQVLVKSVIVRGLSFVLDTLLNNPLVNIPTSMLQANLIKELYSGRRNSVDEGMNYLLVGTGGVTRFEPGNNQDYYNGSQPTAYYKSWDDDNNNWKWQPIEGFERAHPKENLAYDLVCDPWENSDYESHIICQLGEDTYRFSNNFIPFSYVDYGTYNYPWPGAYLRGFYFDQVAFFRNGVTLGTSLLPKWIALLPHHNHNHKDKHLPYMFYNYLSDDNVTRPLMYASWGGILGYQPYLNSSNAESLDYIWEGAEQSDRIGNPFLPSHSVRPSLKTARSLALCMVNDNRLQGALDDYVVNKVLLDDGYQTYITFYDYMPDKAAYSSTRDLIIYNQVRVATGGSDYTSTTQSQGWIEYYFYTGGLHYAGSPFGQLPFDPAVSQDKLTFNQLNSSQTNAGQYYSLLTGQLYCQRTMINASNSSAGYEVERQQTFYLVFNQFPVDNNNQNAQLSLLPITGALPTLTVNYLTNNTTSYANIEDAYLANIATIKYSYYFYDIADTYTPWEPNKTDHPYILWTTESYPLYSALPLARLTYVYSLQENATVLNALYQQFMPGLIGVSQWNNSSTNQSPYLAFINQNDFSSVIQSISWENSSLPITQGTFPVPATTWTSGWQVTGSQVNTWNMLTPVNGTQALWYPASQYRWQGSLTASVQLTPMWFPWSSLLNNSTMTEWVQNDTITQISTAGVVLETTNNIGTPTAYIYDQQNYRNVATMVNADIGFYLGFEIYENLSNWSLIDVIQSAPIPFSFSTLSYTGNRSLLLAGSENNANAYFLVFKPTTPVTYDNRDWLLSMTVFSAKDNNSFALEFFVNENTLPLGVQALTLSKGWTTTNLLLNDFTKQSITTIDTMTVTATLDSGTGDVLVDNLYLLPTTEAAFSVSVYDTVINQLSTEADLGDRQFSERYLFDNLGRPLGKLRKNAQLNQIDFATLSAPYYARQNILNNNRFVATDPNSRLDLTAGLNGNAGYYFDFRDGLNPWSSGDTSTTSVQDRLLLLPSNQSAQFPLPTNNSYGFAMQVQIQGYVPSYQASFSGSNLSGSLLGQFVASGSLDSPLWGLSGFGESSANSYAPIRLSAEGALSMAASASMTGVIPVVSSTGQILLGNYQNNYFGVFQEATTKAYGLYQVFWNTATAKNSTISIVNRLIYSSSDSNLFPPLLALHDLLFFADVNQALYAVDVGKLYDSPENFVVREVLGYANLLAENTTCVAQPVVGGSNNAQIALILKNGNNILLVKYDAGSGAYLTSNYISANYSETVNQPVTIDEFGNVFAISTANRLYAFDSNLNFVQQLLLTEDHHIVGQPVAGRGIVAIAFSNGFLLLLTASLELIANVKVANTLVEAPVFNGNDISVVGQDKTSNQFSVYTYNTAGLLVTAPYVSSATSSLNINAYTAQSNLLLMADATTFIQLELTVPSASLSMGDYTVSWDATTSQFSLSGPDISVSPVTVGSTQGSWLFILLNPVLYFYADGQQIFAVTVDISALPTGNFTIEAGDNALSCRDILLLNDPTLATQYLDGESKVRQTQQVAST